MTSLVRMRILVSVYVCVLSILLSFLCLEGWGGGGSQKVPKMAPTHFFWVPPPPKKKPLRLAPAIRQCLCFSLLRLWKIKRVSLDIINIINICKLHTTISSYVAFSCLELNSPCLRITLKIIHFVKCFIFDGILILIAYYNKEKHYQIYNGPICNEIALYLECFKQSFR